MKKIFFALATVAALASCSKSEVEYEQTSEITFTPVTKNITKSMITGTTFPTTESFNVWAWYNQVPAGTTADSWDTTTDNLYVTEGQFVYKSAESSWGGATPYYWPKVGSLLFAGYYPSTVAAKADYVFDGTVNRMIFKNIPQSEVVNDANVHSEDLMYFNMTEVTHNSGPVAVVFKHALSWVTVNLQRDDFAVNASGYPKITVHSVTFTNVNPQGTGVVGGTDGEIDWTVNGTLADKTVNSGDVVLTTSAQKQIEPLFIPQELTSAMELQVNYTIASSATESFTETHTTKLKGMTGTTPKPVEGNPDNVETVTVNSWDPAKHYVYNVVMGLEEILIEPTVADWTPVTIAVPL